ncbi:MAG TPA: hypothetical protein VIC63_00025 [Candidatus Limnocylindria bacterium]|jgi:hypothetical protein
MDAVPASRRDLRVRRDVWLLVIYGIANLGILLLLRPAPNADWATAWWNLESWGAEVYEHPWRYSPVLLPVFSVIVAAGPWALAAAHFVALPLLLRLGWWPFWLVAFSAFFWVDLVVGNVFTFVAIAAAFAIAGSRPGSIAFFLLTVVMPRPVQLPLALWLVWRRPDLRLAFAALITLHAVGLVVSGLGAEWVRSLGTSSELTFAPFSVGPGTVFGFWWLLVGIPLAAVMVWRGSAAAASLAGVVASPFLLPQYLLMGIVAIPGLLEGRPSPTDEP